MPELKPCPFCGGQPELYPRQRGDYNTAYIIRCWKCMVWFDGRAQADVVEKWNTRAGEMKGDEGV